MSAEPPKSSGLSAKVDKKRKREAEESKENKAAAPSAGAEGPNKKRKDNKNKGGKNDKKDKKNRKVKKDKKDKPQQNAEPKDPKVTESKGSINEDIGKMDGGLLADHLMQKSKRHNKNLTSVELSDLSIPGMIALRMPS